MARLKVALSALMVVGTGLVGTGLGPVAATAAPAHATIAEHHRCTKTSSGTCIRGGEFCKQSEYGEHGRDAKGRRYTCKGDRTHPHWEK